MPSAPFNPSCLQILAPHFTAAVEFGEDGRVNRAAPILGYMVGWPITRVLNYAHRQGWTCVDPVIHEKPPTDARPDN